MIFDPGLQPERTSLAWNRTALSIIVGGFAGLKVLPAMMGSAGLVAALGVIVAGGALGIAAHRRTARATAALVRGDASLPDARLLVAMSVLVAVIAAVALAAVLAKAATG